MRKNKINKLLFLLLLSFYSVISSANSIEISDREVDRLTRGNEQLIHFFKKNSQQLSDVYLISGDDKGAAKKQLSSDFRALRSDYPLFRFFERISSQQSMLKDLSRLDSEQFPRIVAVASRLALGIRSTCDIYDVMIEADMSVKNRAAGADFEAKALCHLNENNTDAAIKTIANADRLIPGGYPLGHLTLGDYFHSVGDYHSSFREYQQAGLVGYGDSKLDHLKKLKGSAYLKFEPQRTELIQDIASRLTINFLLVKNYKKAQEACELGRVCDTYFNLKDKNGRTPLIAYARYDDDYFFELIPHLLKAGADINQKDFNGNTAIFYAAIDSADKKVTELANAGADLSLDNISKRSFLDLVSLYSEQSTLDIILRKISKSELNRLGPDDMTPLMHAARSGNIDTIKKLVAAGADINTTDVHGRTAYLYALLNNQEVARMELARLGALTTGKINITYKEGTLKEIIEFDPNDGLVISSFMSKNRIHKRMYRQGKHSKIQEFAWYVESSPEAIDRTYQLVDGKLDGEDVFYYLDGKVSEVRRYDNGVFKGSIGFTRNGVISYEFSPTSKPGVWEKKFYYRDTKRLLESYRMTDVESLTDYTLTDFRIFDKNGNVIERETYDKNGNIVSTTRDYDFKFQAILQAYLDHPERGVFNYFLDLEESTGLNVSDARDKLEAIITDAGKRIEIKDRYTEMEAKSIMNTIGRVIRSHGIVYDDDHINVFSKVLDNRRMDCDIISYLYLSIGERYNLPVAMVFYPRHAALVWNGTSVRFFWEATSDEELKIRDYQQWLGDSWFANLSQHAYYAKATTKRNTFLSGLSLIIDSLITEPEKQEASHLIVQENYPLPGRSLKYNPPFNYLVDVYQWKRKTFTTENVFANLDRAYFLSQLPITPQTNDLRNNVALDIYHGISNVVRKSREDKDFYNIASHVYIPILVEEFERTGYFYEALDTIDRFYQGKRHEMSERYEKIKEKLKKQDAKSFAS